jgi:hypothetical protein
MNRDILYQANKLQSEIDRYNTLASKAYNSHIYLKIFIDDIDVTKEVEHKEIADILYEHFRENVGKFEKELDEL